MGRACFDSSGSEGSACHRHVVEYAPDGILIMDIDGRIVYANRRMMQMLGHPPGELTGLLLDGLIPDEEQKSVVAEGGETEDQLHYLESNRCDEIQGFLFSRPLPAAECERLMREKRYLAVPTVVAS